MSQEDILTFDEALEEAGNTTKNLLLGNGFSIACRKDFFTYKSLFEQARDELERSPKLQSVFKELDDNNFESVIKKLEDASKLVSIYTEMPNIHKKMETDASKLKDILIDAIVNNHPETPCKILDHKFNACREFLSNFIGDEKKGSVYTLNYDLLLYWTILQDSSPTKLNTNDGFGKKDNNIIWNDESKQNIYFLHGAVHLFDTGSQFKKYTYKENIPLLTQIKEAMGKSLFPLFVAEGESSKKLEKIKHNAYLYHAFTNFSSKMQESQPLFIYGHSLADSDDHIINAITEGKVEQVFISLYGNIGSESNIAITKKIKSMKEKRRKQNPLNIRFFDAESAKVWGVMLP